MYAGDNPWYWGHFEVAGPPMLRVVVRSEESRFEDIGAEMQS